MSGFIEQELGYCRRSTLWGSRTHVSCTADIFGASNVINPHNLDRLISESRLHPEVPRSRPPRS